MSGPHTVDDNERHFLHLDITYDINNNNSRGAPTGVVANPGCPCVNRKIEISLSLFAREAVSSRVSTPIPLTGGESGVCIVYAHFKK